MLELDVKTFNKWRHEQWSLYASDKRGNAQLRLFVNGFGNIRIKCGDDIVYEGSNEYSAVEFWNECIGLLY